MAILPRVWSSIGISHSYSIAEPSSGRRVCSETCSHQCCHQVSNDLVSIVIMLFFTQHISVCLGISSADPECLRCPAKNHQVCYTDAVDDNI